MHLFTLFKKSAGIKISKLRETKSMKFGHGVENSYLDPNCIRCGGTHKSKECIHLQDPSCSNGKIPEINIKCANCGEKHTANYSKCSKRIQFAQQQ